MALKYNLEVMIFEEGYEGYTDTDTHDENSMNFNMRQQNSSWEMRATSVLSIWWRSIDLQIAMQGAPPLAPVPGKARESRKTDDLHSTVTLCLGFRFFFQQ